MDNEPSAAIINGDNTDTHSQVNETTDNVSRHSSRVGSARSGRSKAASVREAVAIDDEENRKQSGNVASTSPKPEVTTNGDRQPSAVVRSKPQSPIVPALDTPTGDFNDDMNNQDDDGTAEMNAIVS